MAVVTRRDSAINTSAVCVVDLPALAADIRCLDVCSAILWSDKGRFACAADLLIPELIVIGFAALYFAPRQSPWPQDPASRASLRTSFFLSKGGDQFVY
jgi:hypothetical protein